MKMNIARVGIVYCFLLIAGIVAVGRIIDLQFIHKPDPTSGVTKKITKDDVVECMRGSILSDDGRYLAYSIPEYRICMDCMQASDTLFNANIDSLSIKLASFYKDKSAAQYKLLITSQRNEERRYTVINKRLLTYQEMKTVSSFPILNKGLRRGGLQVEKFEHREYPYGRLAYRTLGYIRNNQERPKIGIEGKCDSILRGTNGIQPMKLTEHNNWIQDNEKLAVAPIDGTDIQTTINVDIQDIAETALLRVIKNSDMIMAGTAIVMEVGTGEIKALVNMEKTQDGFDETYNYAIGRKGEPGSVFKLATLTVLLEDKKVTLDQKIKAVVQWSYRGRALPPDNYLKSYDSISIQRGFEISSNNVFRMSAARYYDDNPARFIKQLNDVKISYNYDFDINGFVKAHIKTPEDKSWAPVDLPQIAMGYTLELTPLHTICYYNAIANNGVMVKPHLIRNYRKNGAVIKDFPTETIGKVCSDETAAELHKALRGVVVEGTGKTVFKGCKVAVAGKTGTARVVLESGGYMDRNGRKKHQATFAGFFPYESPKYSVIVVVYTGLTHQNFYGGTWAAPVVREIAEKLYASSPEWNNILYKKGACPEIQEYNNYIINDTLQGIPNVIGMGLRDGLFTLENKGYNVTFSGSGIITSQEPKPGTITDKKTITLILSTDYATDTLITGTHLQGE